MYILLVCRNERVLLLVGHLDDRKTALLSRCECRLHVISKKKMTVDNQLLDGSQKHSDETMEKE